MKKFLIIVSIILLVFLSVTFYACCVAAGDADERSERIWHNFQKEKEKAKSEQGDN